jgi:proton-dependent oligopeptide transporter, POT family
MSQQDLRKKQFQTLFSIEMWERFAFYTFNGLFILFALHTYFTQSSAYLTFGIFMALAYGLPTVGGYLADNLIGIQRALMLGAGLLVTGYLLLALASSYHSILFALSVIAVGNALFKPNPSAMVGLIYKGHLAESHSAFTMYYMSINIGSVIAVVFSPLIAKYTSFSVAFWIAFIGMGFALLNFIRQRKIFSSIHNNVGKLKLEKKNFVVCAVMLIFMVFISYVLLIYRNAAFYIVVLFTIACYLYLLLDSFSLKTKELRIKQVVGVMIFLQATIFFIIYSQMFSTLVIFAKNNINLSLFGFKLSPATFCALNPIWIMLLSPLLSRFYVFQASKNAHSITTDKYAVAMFCCSLAFFVLLFACHEFNVAGKISGIWMVYYYFFTSLAELLISAIGLSVAAHYFPVNKLSFAMGAWLLAQGCGSALSGKIASSFISFPKHITSAVYSISLFYRYFYYFAAICLVLAVIFTAIAIVVRRIAKMQAISFS